MKPSVVCHIAIAFIVGAMLQGCESTSNPYSTSIGQLRPGSTMVVRAFNAEINAYKPEVGKPKNAFVIEAMGVNKDAIGLMPPHLRSGKNMLIVAAGKDATTLLLRVPQGVALDASSSLGDVNVTDITGAVTAHSDNGNVKVMVPGAVQASTGPGEGNVTVYMGTDDWPGTLRFSARHGDVEVWINATARFHAHVHTDNGTIFTDFGLKGTANGTAETIDGNVGGRTAHGVNIEVSSGTIRLLQLKPQM